MESVSQLDRVLKALVAVLFFWFLGVLSYTGGLSNFAGSKARAFHFFIELVVGLFGRAGATAMFMMLGIVAGVAILRSRENI